MRRDLETWQFILERLRLGQPVMLLVVAESSGSSPGRAGYKMAVAADGKLAGSIGGGVMEVKLVEQSRRLLSEPQTPLREQGRQASSRDGSGQVDLAGRLIEQVHRPNSPNSSGMICSGRQTVIFRLLNSDDLLTVEQAMAAFENGDDRRIVLSRHTFELRHSNEDRGPISFELLPDDDFRYSEPVGTSDRLFIIGGGHCALALSEVVSRLGFHISIFDDRPELNTIEKNRFADSVTIVETYETIDDIVPSGDDDYLVVMTLGVASDMQVVRRLIDRDFRYFGVLGSRAKIATMFRELQDEGLDQARLSFIHAPVGVAINSRTPEEIAVSIAAEIIAVRNGRGIPQPTT